MEAAERQRRILDRARRDGRVQVARLADEFEVAPETVRRDLRDLADRGMLHRVHGGAHPIENAGFETGLAYRQTSLMAEKRRIAEAAANRLSGAESVFIDEGITPGMVAQAVVGAMTPGQQLTIVTASLPAAHAVAEAPGVTVLLLGGRVRGVTMATVDHWATRMLKEFVVDLAYLGANGISPSHGLTVPSPAVAAIKSQAVESSRRRIFVGINPKFGVSSFCRYADLPDFEALITDSGVSASEAQRYSAMGPHVIRA